MKLKLRSEGRVRDDWTEGPEQCPHGGTSAREVGGGEKEQVLFQELRKVPHARTQRRREGLYQLRLEQCPTMHSLLSHMKDLGQ